MPAEFFPEMNGYKGGRLSDDSLPLMLGGGDGDADA